MRASIRAAFREQYDKLEQPDRDKLVRNTYRALSEDERKQILMDALHGEASKFFQGLRRNAHFIAADDRPTLSKWKGASDAYQRVIQRPEFVNGDYKFLADCTLDDLVWLQTNREERAADLLNSADEYRDLAKSLDKSGKKYVKDLPPDDVLAAIS